MKRLARLGPPLTVVGRIEAALAAAGRGARAGPLWITPDWVVGLSPTVLVYPTSDLAGVGLVTSASKSGGQVETKHALHFWARGEMLPGTVDVSAAEARAVMEAIARAVPWAMLEDAALFEKRWRHDRAACTREADERRRVLKSSGASPPGRQSSG